MFSYCFTIKLICFLQDTEKGAASTIQKKKYKKRKLDDTESDQETAVSLFESSSVNRKELLGKAQV